MGKNVIVADPYRLHLITYIFNRKWKEDNGYVKITQFKQGSYKGSWIDRLTPGYAKNRKAMIEKLLEPYNMTLKSVIAASQHEYVLDEANNNNSRSVHGWVRSSCFVGGVCSETGVSKSGSYDSNVPKTGSYEGSVSRFGSYESSFSRVESETSHTTRLGSSAFSASRLGSDESNVSRLRSGASYATRLGSGASYATRLGSGALSVSRLGSNESNVSRLRSDASYATRLGSSALSVVIPASNASYANTITVADFSGEGYWSTTQCAPRNTDD
jgi:hypothetical protein